MILPKKALLCDWRPGEPHAVKEFFLCLMPGGSPASFGGPINTLCFQFLQGTDHQAYRRGLAVSVLLLAPRGAVSCLSREPLCLVWVDQVWFCWFLVWAWKCLKEWGRCLEHVWQPVSWISGKMRGYFRVQSLPRELEGLHGMRVPNFRLAVGHVQWKAFS